MLEQLALRNFRNFEKLDVEFPTSGLVIVGENGHGKTNLLEAISYLGLFRSPRGSRDADVIRFGAPAFHVRAALSPSSKHESASVGYERASKRKKAMIDGVEQTRLSEALGALPSVCFSPVDVSLVAGGPAERRHFLDVTLALTNRAYLQALQHYRAALRQRNAALRVAQRASARPGGTHDAQVSIWESALARHGATLAAQRHIWCTTHAHHFARLCEDIGERTPVSMRYASGERRLTEHTAADREPTPPVIVPAPASDPVEGEPVRGGKAGEDPDVSNAGWRADDAVLVLERAFRDGYGDAFEQQRAQELRRGITLVGPHRDELQLSLGERDMRTFGSAGQQRTAAIALRLLELATRRDALGSPPLLLLDDPFAELDANRSARILTLLQQTGVGQVIMTVPRDEDIPSAFTRLDRRVMVNGSLR